MPTSKRGGPRRRRARFGTRGTAAPSRHRVFISHSGRDIWVAQQISASIEALGVSTFLDVRDIKKGDDFKSVILRELPACNELVALYTPWSRLRPWVQAEIGMALAHNLRIVAIFYNVSRDDFRGDEGGLGPIGDLNILDLNDFDTYLNQLRRRIGK